ncbi:MAG: 3-dehydroquinate synthase [Armatimonadota bacterium]|nr:3-dehydroquinate synthase [Armatimonadota bacterium]
MATIRVELGDRSYDIRVEPGALGTIGEMATAACSSRSAAVVTNPKIGGLYAGIVTKSLEAAGIRCALITIPAGERYKSLNTCRRLYDEFLSAKLDRGSVVVALGGGVIGDIAGFAAATYLRGLSFVQVPTTLLAQVDSSVGGKVGINLPQGKNLVGAFHQPKGVLIDPFVLRTLPKREVRAGLAEVIKHGIIYDQGFFDILREKMAFILALDAETVAQIISRSCEIKAGVVAADERESGLREILNFGHSLGHGIETAAGYGRYRHGEAVSIGMVGEAHIAERMGIAERGVTEAIRQILASAGLPTALSSTVSLDAVLTSLALDKKARQGKVRFALPTRIGAVVRRDDITQDMVMEALLALKDGSID